MTKIKIAHSPDTDDYVMFEALRSQKIKSHFELSFTANDIETLNQQALQNPTYDITAVSIYASAHLTPRYALLSSGASVAEQNYGPLLVANPDISMNSLNDVVVGVPGELTTACFLLKLAFPKIKTVVQKPEEILENLKNKTLSAGLIIHEGQLLYASLGLKLLHRTIDTWRDFAGDLPLPLGGNAISKSLDIETQFELAKLCEQSVIHARQNLAETMAYAKTLGQGIDESQIQTYLSWYVNARTERLDDVTLKGIDKVFELARKHGLVENNVKPEIIFPK